MTHSFDRYLRGLVGSWQAFADAHTGAQLQQTAGYVALRSPFAVLNNAVLLAPEDLDEVVQLYDGVPFAVWTRENSLPPGASLTRDVTTTPMVLDLRTLGTDAGRPACDLSADTADVARLNGVDPDLLRDVEGLRCAVTPDGDCGLVVQDVGRDVVISFVATRPSARGRGLASRLMAEVLQDAVARDRGWAVLQATPMAEGLYRRLGFEPVGTWHEWTG